jgi:non-heme chloroperoxidase
VVLACIAFSRTDLPRDLGAMTVPTPVIHGDRDAIVPLRDEPESALLTGFGAKAVVLEKRPHGLDVSHANEFIAKPLDFLAQKLARMSGVVIVASRTST